MADRQRDDIPVPRLRFPEADAPGSTAADRWAPDAPEQSVEPKAPARSGWTRAVPVAVAVTVTILGQQYADDISTTKVVALLLLVVLAAFFEHQYRHRR